MIDRSWKIGKLPPFTDCQPPAWSTAWIRDHQHL